MAAFLQDPTTNDLVLVGGNLTLVPTQAEEVAQRLRNTFLMWSGEWFLDQNLGVPYFAGVLGKQDLRTVTQLLRNVAAGVLGVAQIVTFTTSLDRTARVLTVQFQILTTDGTLVAGSTGVS